MRNQEHRKERRMPTVKIRKDVRVSNSDRIKQVSNIIIRIEPQGTYYFNRFFFVHLSADYLQHFRH